MRGRAGTTRWTVASGAGRDVRRIEALNEPRTVFSTEADIGFPPGQGLEVFNRVVSKMRRQGQPACHSNSGTPSSRVVMTQLPLGQELETIFFLAWRHRDGRENGEGGGWSVQGMNRPVRRGSRLGAGVPAVVEAALSG